LKNVSFDQASAFRVSGPPGPGGRNCTKTFLGQMGMRLQNFIKICARVWISISPPRTNRQRNKHTSVRPSL